MTTNKDFRNILIFGSAATLLLSGCGLFFCGPAAGALLLLLGAVLIGLFSYYTRQRYKALENLNAYLSLVLTGENVPEIEEQEEGEISILRSNIFKTATTLQTQKELLSKDKVRLADAIADISHQLKTPLTSMMVMNDLLIGEEDPDRRISFLATQQAQLDRMNWLIQTLLKLSKLDAGTIELRREETSVKTLVDEAVKPFEIQMELKGIEVDISCDEMFVRCDRYWTIEAIQNIIKNCCEHMNGGGRLRIRTEDTNLFGQISIEDTGGGIAAEDLPHIFERFYKGKNAGKDSVGIGLALSKAIMEGQHGDILVTSEEGVGTKFDVRFYKTII